MVFSVVIPVYGCRAALEELYERLTKTLSSITDDYEIIMVNDSCPQNSWEVIEKLCLKDSHVIGIEMSRNFGQIKAITAGLDYSTGEWVVVMDCDLQDRPEEIRNMYDKVQEGYDAVFARRKVRKDSALKVLISNIFYKIYDLATDGHYDPAICNFSMVNRRMVDEYCKMRELHRAYVIYMKWLGFHQTTLDVEHDPRKEGKSSYNMKKRLQLALEILTSQSDKLIKIMVGFGFLMTCISFLAVLILIVYYFTSHVLMGWTSMVATMCLLAGILIMVVGVVGIYVGNIFMQVKERPLYVIRDIKNAHHKRNRQMDSN
ncbi:MAG: glycosyltransferase family 2 protein [Lachnospiraceae bacterium]|nr:glycosyltransferase family 2 protein [Lachnospiraceae bacterium]